MIVLCACAKPAAVRDTCSPEALHLAAAKPLPVLQLPATCKIEIADGQTLVMRSATECGVDFMKDAMVVTRRQLSPAMTGVDALDDGKTVTIVSRFRTACPGEPPPMPITQTYAFVLAGGGERVFAEASCTVTSKCR